MLSGTAPTVEIITAGPTYHIPATNALFTPIGIAVLAKPASIVILSYSLLAISLYKEQAKNIVDN